LDGFNKLTEKAGGLGGSLLRLGAVFAGLRVANGLVKGLIKHFVDLKGSVTGTS
jgi:hypothetical protein